MVISWTRSLLAVIVLLATFSFLPISTHRFVYSQERVKCARCEKVGVCKQVCRLVCESEKVEVVCWGIKSEDFCVPGPSIPSCEHCEQVTCGCEQGLDPKVKSKPKLLFWTHWLPTGAKLHTKKKLMRRVVIEEIPSHKWIVEDLCAECREGSAENLSVVNEVSGSK